MTYHNMAIIIAGLLSISCYIPYIRDILRGKTKPERASWLIWSVLGSIALFSQASLGVKASLILIITQTIGTTAVFLLALRYGVEISSSIDMLALFFASQGLVIWHFTYKPLVAFITVITIDAIGVYLTVAKTYKNPGPETVLTWGLTSLAGVVTIATNNNYNISILLYPIYSICLNITVLTAIYDGHHKTRKNPIC